MSCKMCRVEDIQHRRSQRFLKASFFRGKTKKRWMLKVCSKNRCPTEDCTSLFSRQSGGNWGVYGAIHTLLWDNRVASARFFEGKIQSPPSTDYSTLQTCIALETKFTSIAPGSYIYDTSNSFNYLHQFEKSTNTVLKKRKFIGLKCSEPVHYLS